MVTSLGFTEPPDSTVLAAVYNRIRLLAGELDTFLKTTTGVVTLASGVTAANATVGGIQLTKQGRRVQLQAELGISTNKAAGALIMTIPTGWRPAPRRANGVAYINNAYSMLLVDHLTGELNFPFAAAPAGGGVFLNATWTI